MSKRKYFVVKSRYDNSVETDYTNNDLEDTLVEALARKKMLEDKIKDKNDILDRDAKVFVAQIIEVDDIGFYVRKKK